MGLRHLALAACLHVGAMAMRSQPDSHVLAPALSGPKSVCVAKVDSLDSKWCQANCEATPGTNLCKAACTCSAVAREPTTKAKAAAETDASNATTQAAGEASEEEHGCRSHTDTVDDEWCGLTCAATPDTDDCVANCRCPGWQKNGAIARQREQKVEQASEGHCAALKDAMTADWCDATCRNTPNADQCWEACQCPGRKRIDPRLTREREEKREKGITGHCTPIGSLVSAGWCDGSCLNTPNAGQCYDVCDCPGKHSHRPSTLAPSPLPEKTVCKSKVESVADEWCDQTCIKTPNDKSCTATCHCPGWREALKEEGAPEPSPSPAAGEANTTCRSVVDTATAEWCDGNCAKDPNAEWCEPACRCPGYNATLAAQRIATRGHNCTGIIDTASGNWCDENCGPNPDTPQCTKLCICGSSTPKLHASPAPAICEVLAAAASTASSEWCDQNCLAKPATDSCKATCKCPRGTHGAKPEPSPDPEPKEEAKEEAKARPQSVVALLAAHAPLASTQSWLQRFLFLSQFEQVRLM